MKKALLVMLALAISGCLYILFFSDQQSSSTTKEEAIQQAQSYQPDGLCTDALVPAVHKETGAKFTFSNGCLAPGWEPER